MASSEVSNLNSITPPIASGDLFYVIDISEPAGVILRSRKVEWTVAQDSIDHALSPTGTLTLGGTGNTNNETLAVDFETVADQVGISSATGVTQLTWTSLNHQVSSTNWVGLGSSAGHLLFTDAATDALSIVNANFYVSDGTVGIGTTAPDMQLEINNATGQCVRLTYNDSNGSADSYVDETVSSFGTLELGPSSQQVEFLNPGEDDLFTMTDAADNVDVQLSTSGDSYFVGGNTGFGTNLPNTTVHNAGGLTVGVTTVNAATYDLLTTDYILHVTYTATAAVTSLTLPTAQVVSGRKIIVKDAAGNASVNSITIDTEGSETIDGAATAVISGDYDSLTLYSDGTNWFIV